MEQPLLSDTQLERYARHIVMPEIGGQGQRKLRSARVLVIGAGGLGSPCLEYLAAAGVGTLGIVDDDVVDLSNLQRQTIHATNDIGRLKVDSAAARIQAINPDVMVKPHPLRLTAANATELFDGYDVIADGSDSFATRLAVSDACVRLGKPLVSAAVGRFDGQLSTFLGHQPDQPCYRCLAGDAMDVEAGSCAEAGVLGALTGVMGALQALEVMRLITGFGEPLTGQLLLYDALSARFQKLRLRKNPACRCSG
jgi:molybdopterin-synthase adenylyltransferase